MNLYFLTLPEQNQQICAPPITPKMAYTSIKTHEMTVSALSM